MWKIKKDIPKKFVNDVLPPFDYNVTYEKLVNELWQVGITEIYIDGSFVENKDHPNDIDGYFDIGFKINSVEDYDNYEKLIKSLNKINKDKVWDWTTRLPAPNTDKWQIPMWHKYKTELYPHTGQGTGIQDQYGNDQEFPAAFRKSRVDHKEKGIVKIIKE